MAELVKEMILEGQAEVVDTETVFSLQLGPPLSIFYCPRGAFPIHKLDHLTPHLETPNPKLQSLCHNIQALEPII